MTHEKEEELDKYIIPDNYINMKKPMGLEPVNIIQGVVVALILRYLISLTPFISEIKLYATVILCIGSLVLFAMGIKGESVFAFMFNMIRYYTKKRNIYHLRRVGYEKKGYAGKKRKEESQFGKLQKKYKESIADIKKMYR